MIQVFNFKSPPLDFVTFGEILGAVAQTTHGPDPETENFCGEIEPRLMKVIIHFIGFGGRSDRRRAGIVTVIAVEASFRLRPWSDQCECLWNSGGLYWMS